MQKFESDLSFTPTFAFTPVPANVFTYLRIYFNGQQRSALYVMLICSFVHFVRVKHVPLYR